MLGCLNCAGLHLLHQFTACAQLPAGGQFHVDLAACGVLDVFFQVKLHDRIAARRAQNICGGNCHDVLGSIFTVALFVGRLSGGLRGP